MAMGGTANIQLIKGGCPLHPVGKVLVGASATNQAVPHGFVDHEGRPLIPSIIILVPADAGAEQVRIGTTPATATNLYLSSANAAAKNVYVYVA